MDSMQAMESMKRIGSMMVSMDIIQLSSMGCDGVQRNEIECRKYDPRMGVPKAAQISRDSSGIQNTSSRFQGQASGKPRMIRMIILMGRMIRMIILMVRMIIQMGQDDHPNH